MTPRLGPKGESDERGFRGFRGFRNQISRSRTRAGMRWGSVSGYPGNPGNPVRRLGINSETKHG